MQYQQGNFPIVIVTPNRFFARRFGGTALITKSAVWGIIRFIDRCGNDPYQRGTKGNPFVRTCAASPHAGCDALLLLPDGVSVNRRRGELGMPQPLLNHVE